MASIHRLRTEEGLLSQIGPRVAERIRTLALSNSLVCGRIARITEAKWNPARVDITNIVHGRRAVTTLELSVLAEALECRAAYLLGEEDEQ